MTKTITSFSRLVDGERELSKNEIAMYLDLYYRFVNLLVKKENIDKSFIELFSKVKNKSGNNIIINTSNFTEYDYMVQIAQFYTINKFYSIFIDSNFDYFDASKIKKYKLDEKCYVLGSNRFPLDTIIKLIRNALNHNDKEDYQLFRLVQSSMDPDIYLEIFLRKPNLHLRLKVKELAELFSQLIDTRSSFGFKYIDKNGNVLTTKEEFLNHYRDDLSVLLSHFYDFDVSEKEKNKGVITNGTALEFYKIFKLDDYQKEAITSIMNKLSKDNNEDYSQFIGYIIKDVIPFGMAKISGYKTDINYLFNCLYYPRNCYKDYICKANNRSFINHYVEAETLYYTLNRDALLSRSFSLFASYVFDTLITSKQIKVNNLLENRSYYRNSFVHGRWYDFFNEGGIQEIIIRDYPYGDSNIMTPSKGQEKEKRIIRDELYEVLHSKIREEDYDLPLDLIKDTSGNGYHITFREEDITYYCNMSITGLSPIFLLIGYKKGQVLICNNEHIKKLEEKIKIANLDGLDPRMRLFCKKISNICKKALNNFLLSTDYDDYKKRMDEEIVKLNNICLEIKLGIDSSNIVKHFYYEDLY